MPSFENLKEEIREVYHIFDEDEAGNMSMAELARALYTITGERLPRSALRKLVTAARESLARRSDLESSEPYGEAPGGGTGEHDGRSNGSSANASPSTVPKSSTGERMGRAPSIANSVVSSSRTAQSRNAVNMNAAAAEEGIDLVTFEEIVLRKLNSRNPDEEVAYTFALLEDQYYPGFITKESLQRAAMEAEEPLTQAELTEMFDALVTGAPTAAVDLITFRSVQSAALKAHEADVREAMAETEAEAEAETRHGTPREEPILADAQAEKTQEAEGTEATSAAAE